MPHPAIVRIRQHFERPRHRGRSPPPLPAALEGARPCPTHPSRADGRPDRRQPRHRQHPGHPPRGRRIPQDSSAPGRSWSRPWAATAAAPPRASAQVLESYGITEEFVGAPIRASMEAVQVGTTAEGYPVLLDRHASEADHIGVVARVKPHTGYHGPIESGLMKMMMIGLGKHAGRPDLPPHPARTALRPASSAVGRTMLAKAAHRLRPGHRRERLRRDGPHRGRRPGAVRGARGGAARAGPRAAAAAAVRQGGPADHRRDRQGHQRLGHGHQRRRPQAGLPRSAGRRRHAESVRLIFVRGLSEHTHGNAAGIGLADFTTTRLVKEMNYRATVINCLTAGYPEGAFIPVHFDTDREVIDAALAIIGTRPPEQGRVMHIRNTLHLDEVEVVRAVPDRPDPAERVHGRRPPHSRALRRRRQPAAGVRVNPEPLPPAPSPKRRGGAKTSLALSASGRGGGGSLPSGSPSPLRGGGGGGGVPKWRACDHADRDRVRGTHPRSAKHPLLQPPRTGRPAAVDRSAEARLRAFPSAGCTAGPASRPGPGRSAA